ncbi:MAG: hypothetical protein AAGE89_03940 [Pseudomonadota bacterium]
MFRHLKTAVFAALAFGLAGTGAANAATAFDTSVSPFEIIIENGGGSFILTDAQAAFLGVPDGSALGLARLDNRDGQFTAGTTFDATTIFDGTIAGSGNIVGIFNGTNTSNLSFTGDAFDPLGLTTIDTTGTFIFDAFYLAFTPGTNVVFPGSDTFGKIIDGVAPVPVPLPAALPLALAGFGMLAFVRSRRRKAATA